MLRPFHLVVRQASFRDQRNAAQQTLAVQRTNSVHMTVGRRLRPPPDLLVVRDGRFQKSCSGSRSGARRHCAQARHPAYEVTIADSDDFHGTASFDNPMHDWRAGDGSKIKAANNFAVAAYAGIEAERALLGSQMTSDEDDHRKAEDCLAWAGAVKGAGFVGDAYYDKHTARLRRKASLLVREHLTAIQGIAKALVDRETLSGPEVDAILKS
jgi:hypothetical protein